MHDANQREEQFRKRIQPNNNPDTPKDIPPSISTVSSESSLSFHTPAIDQSPGVVPTIDINSSPSTIETMNPVETNNILSITAKTEISTAIRHTVNEETTQSEYRSAIKFVHNNNAFKSTIQNYLMDHNPLDDNEVEDLPEKTYDWDAIISNGPQFKYNDSFGKFKIKFRFIFNLI